LLGLASNPAFPDRIYAVGKLSANSTPPHFNIAPLTENVVVEVDVNIRNKWSVIATLRNDVKCLPCPYMSALSRHPAADCGKWLHVPPFDRRAVLYLGGKL
jgi:hypothetical protein